MSKTIFPELIITMDGVMVDYIGPLDGYGDGFDVDPHIYWYGDARGDGGEIIYRNYYRTALGYYTEDGRFCSWEYRP